MASSSGEGSACLNHIDWAATELKFGITSDTPHISNKRVVYACPGCGKRYDLVYKGLRRRRYVECLGCLPKHTADKISAAGERYYTTNPDRLEQLRTAGKEAWPRVRDAMSSGRDRKWREPSYRAAQAERRRADNLRLWSERREEMVARIRAQFTAERRANAAAISTGLWRGPEYADKTLSAIRSDENRAKISRSSRSAWLSTTYRERMALIRSALSGKPSRLETTLYSLLDDLGVEYVRQFPLGFYTFDCMVPAARLLVECNGEYWHSLPKARSCDLAKATYVGRYFPEYSLKTIWEHEFLQPDRVRHLLQYWTGVGVEQVSYDLRQVTVGEVDRMAAKLLLSKYHYGGWGNGKFYFGASLGRELIAVCVFGQVTRKETATRLGCRPGEMLELTRFCIHPRYQKKNLASFLLARCCASLSGYRMLVAFADESHNHVGTIYKAAGWDLDGVVEPSYWYVDGDGYVLHKKTAWNHALRMGTTEADWTEANGFRKVWGLRKRRYIKSL